MEHACLLRAATLLEDPLMMEWALYYYADLPPYSKLRETLATLWFHDLKLHHWIDSGDDTMLGLMMRYLPEKCFTNFLAPIAARWGNLPPTMVNAATRVLVGADPTLAVTTFGQSLTENPQSLNQGMAVLDILDRLPPVSALSLFEKLRPLIHGGAGSSLSFLQAAAFGAAVRLEKTGDLSILLDGTFSERGEHLEGVVRQIGHHLFGHDSYVEICLSQSAGERTASFAGLAPLLHNAAPLEEMDTALASSELLTRAMSLLQTHHWRCAQSSLVWDLIRKSKKFHSGEHPQAFGALALAGVAAAFERKTLDLAGLGANEIVALLCLDLSTNIHYEALLECLRDMPRAEVVHATRRHLVETSNGYGEIVLARLMGDLACNEFVPTLMACIDDNKGDAVCEAAERSLIAIGEPARDAVIALWETLDISQKICGSSVIRNVGGAAVAEFTLRRSEELLRDNIESWCRFLMAQPDARHIGLVRPELRRNQHAINETFYRLCRLLGVDSVEQADLRPKLIAHLEEKNRRQASFSEAVLPDSASVINLSLRCPSCGDVNHYPVKKIILGDPESGYPYLLADEFACLSCGEFVDFLLEAEANFVLMGEMIRQQLAHSEGAQSRSKVLAALKIVQPDGVQLDAPQAYALLRERIVNQPDDWLSWFRLANINNAIDRPIAAQACLEKAYAINPLPFDTILNLASTLTNNGQENVALNLMNTALERRLQWQTLGFQVSDKVSAFAKLFNQLRGSTGRADLAALHPQFYKPPTNAGRNDPCPCGSGRKFKKCCMQ